MVSCYVSVSSNDGQFVWHCFLKNRVNIEFIRKKLEIRERERERERERIQRFRMKTLLLLLLLLLLKRITSVICKEVANNNRTGLLTKFAIKA